MRTKALRVLAYGWLMFAAGLLTYALYHDGRTAEALTHGFMLIGLIGLALTEREHGTPRV